MSKVLIKLHIEATIEEDGGYYSDTETLGKPIEMIRNISIPKYKVLIGKGIAEAQLIPAKITVTSIAFTDLDKK